VGIIFSGCVRIWVSVFDSHTFRETQLTKCPLLGSTEGLDNQTQISFPALPAAGSPLRFELLREWLQWCDKSHENCNRRDFGKLPTRVLYVGDPDDPDYNPNILKLVPSKQIRGERKYVALSHCWGDPKDNEALPYCTALKNIGEPKDDKVPPYCTTPENVSKRQEGFEIAKLPLTFRDAIEVVRRLNVKYLWIDSLCIIQGNRGDWEEESKVMEDVYALAYCTIAATSADDSHAGFLKRNIEYVYVQDNSGRRVYIGTDIADFDDEVENARLNTRAWVMQERFLSCRTIHFGNNQMYWECGEGVYCEDLSQLKR
jgi:hypothetical protein